MNDANYIYLGKLVHEMQHELDNEGQRGVSDEGEQRGVEELHQGDGGWVPQQDSVRVQERHQAPLHHPVDHQWYWGEDLDW